jgi:enolase
MLIDKYNLLYVEDPLQEEDFRGFGLIKKKHLIVGDDLTATQIKRLENAIKNKSINALIVKPNQNGSLIELKKIFDICKANGIKTIMSHRSGETMDNALADYAFAFGADYIKTGIATKWREAKLNRMIEIENSFK